MQYLALIPLIASLVDNGLAAAAGGSCLPPASSAICSSIARQLSNSSSVFYPGDPVYEAEIEHWDAASTQRSWCVVEPSTPQEVGKLLVFLGNTNTPFAVKSGGHATNIGFSSTTGVHISLARFTTINYNKNAQTVEVGPGQVFDKVYAALEPLGVGVMGGRVAGIGIGGFLLGGGYSWQSNQYGLAMDNVVAYELVKPTGQVVNVTKTSDPDLFFGLKGGMNNFGIVTKFTLKTFPQGQVWGGFIVNLEDQVPALEKAIVKYQATVKDPKANIIMAYNYQPALKQVAVSQLLFYNGPKPPAGIFDDFLAAKQYQANISTRSFTSLIGVSPLAAAGTTRSLFNCFPVLNMTAGISDILLNETRHWGPALANKTMINVSYQMNVFQPSVLSINPAKTAYPPSRQLWSQPFQMSYSWNSSAVDADMHAASVASAAHIQQAVVAQGQKQVVDAAIYPNLGLAGTPVEAIYGSNLPTLRALKARVDPHNVMGLTGGWRI